MKLPPDQLKLRLQAAQMTLNRLTAEVLLDENAHLALCRAQWHIFHELELIEATERR